VSFLKKGKKPKKLLLFGGFILVLLSFAVAGLLVSLQYEELWRWYAEVKHKLADLEEYILHIDIIWQFIVAVLLLFAIKSFFPIYATSTVCFITGIVLPIYVAVPVNIAGFVILLTIRYFCSKKFGAGNARKMISKLDVAQRLIQTDVKANPALLIALRLIPGIPINGISGIYGSYEFGYVKFIVFSLIGFLPRLLSFTFVGRNVYDPLSSEFLVPIMILLFLSGISLLSINGVWITVEKTVEFAKKRKIKKLEKKGIAQND
jgi:uncharacterized membrane protein YdjX (TVP38/TMEM64 family)